MSKKTPTIFLEIDTTPELLEKISKSFLEAKETQSPEGVFYIALPTESEELHVRFKWDCRLTKS